MELTPILPQDTKILQRLLTDRTIGKTYMLPDYQDPQLALPLVERMIQLSRDPDRFVRAIRLQGQMIGFLNDPEIQNGCIELGYVIDPDKHNHGYMTRALRLAIGQLLAQGYHMVKAGAFEHNAASLRVMEKAGMHRIDYTDYVEYHGVSHRCIYYAITKDEYHAEV